MASRAEVNASFRVIVPSVIAIGCYSDDDVIVLRVPRQVVLDIRADRDDPQTTPTGVVQRKSDECGPDAAALVD